MLFYESFFGQYFYSTKEKILEVAERMTENQTISSMFSMLDFYERLEIPCNYPIKLLERIHVWDLNKELYFEERKGYTVVKYHTLY